MYEIPTAIGSSNGSPVLPSYSVTFPSSPTQSMPFSLIPFKSSAFVFFSDWFAPYISSNNGDS